MTTDAWEYGSAMQISTHTLTWSVTFLFAPALTLFSDFNSHAHVERDGTAEFVSKYFNISTHTLTWSVTRNY